MNPLRQLISQTAIYGLSSIVGRFLNYLLVPLYTYSFSAQEYGVVSEFYAYAGFFAVLLIFGLETGYFRFRQREGFQESSVYNNAMVFLVVTNILFLILLLIYLQPLADALQYSAHPEYLYWFAIILALDATTALPFARLRAENKAWRFVGIKLTEIALTIGFNLFFILMLPKIQNHWPDIIVSSFYDPNIGVGYIFIANLLASVCKWLLLLPQFKNIPVRLNPKTLKTLLAYSIPMVMIGFAGMVNEMLDRAILKYFLPYDPATNLKMLGIYGACYKLSILMTLFVQAFRYAGEPFFFSIAGKKDAAKAYALIMNYFVIFGIFIFLLVTLYIDFFKYFIGTEFREGLAVVPILLIANLLLGIYINLSIWYKLTDRTGLGAWVSIIGALLTAALNVWWIPIWGYMGSAWATLACYTLMVLLSFLLGRRFYPVHYNLGKIFGYMSLGLLLYFVNGYVIDNFVWNRWLSASGGLFIYLFAAFIIDIRPLLKRSKALIL